MFCWRYPFGKGRISIPYRFGLQPGTAIFVRKGPGKLLTFFSNSSDQRGGCLIRIGSQRRISIPPHLKRFAGIENGGVVLGCGRYVEFMNKEKWELGRGKLNV